MNKKSKKLMSEEDVKKALNVKDFRSLSKDKIMDFVSIIPNIDKEIAISIINQFPNYAKLSKDMVGGMIGVCNKSLESSESGNKEVIETYKGILETLKEELNNGDLSTEDKKEINEKMIMIAEKIDFANDKHNKFIKDILNTVGGTIVGVILVGATILGLKNNNDGK